MGCVVYCMSLALSCSISSAGQKKAQQQSECLTVFVVCCIDVPCCLEGVFYLLCRAEGMILIFLLIEPQF